MKPRMDYKVPAALLIGIILGGIGGWVFAGKSYQKKAVAFEENIKTDLRNTLQEKGITASNAPDVDIAEAGIVEEVRALSGTIFEVNDSTIVVEVVIPSGDILTPDSLQKIFVNVNDNTALTMSEEKDFETFNRELLVHDRLLANIDPENLGELPEPPNAFTMKDIEITDLVRGDFVTVNLDEVYSGENTVTASSVVVEQRVLLPDAPPEDSIEDLEL